ncbi:MAG: diguanylate cyclase [Pseudomonadota bacterium]
MKLSCAPLAGAAAAFDPGGLFDHAAAGIAWFDADDVLRYANRWFESSYNVVAADHPSWEDMMRNCHATRQGVLIDTDDIDGWISAVRLRRRSRPTRSFESDLTDGRWVWVVETIDAGGGVLTLASDISDLKRREVVLQQNYDHALHVSQRDSLTGLYNRRYAFEYLQAAVAASVTGNTTLILVMIDIDQFKACNDLHGHDVGDQVLRDFAERLRSGIRASDVAARIGGEEFLLIMPELQISGVAMLLNRLQVAEPMPSRLPAYTFSAGVTAVRPDDCPETLFRRTDRALYTAKNRGRNRYVIV